MDRKRRQDDEDSVIAPGTRRGRMWSRRSLPYLKSSWGVWTAWRPVKDCLKANVLVVELKSEALKDRHWKQLMKRMGEYG